MVTPDSDGEQLVAPQDGLPATAGSFESNASDDPSTLIQRWERIYTAPLLSLCRSFRMANDADDIIQTAFFQTLQQLQKGVKIPNPEGWLRKVTNNLCINRGKQRKAMPLSAGIEPATNASEVIETVSATEISCLVNHAIDQLEEKYRAVVVYRKQGLTLQEIATLLGCSTKTVTRRETIGYAQLKRNLVKLFDQQE